MFKKLIQRPWQTECVRKAMLCLRSETSREFLIDAAPGSGKTICALLIAQILFSEGLIDRIIYITPRKTVGKQWCSDAKKILGRNTLCITGADEEPEGYGLDVCVTFQAINGCIEGLQAICRNDRSLVIADELHHASGVRSWGVETGGAFSEAKYVLALSGTAIRSDGEAAVWLPLNAHGSISLSEAAVYRLTYGQAVDLEYCRPASFHIHRGDFTVDLEDGESITVSSHRDTVFPGVIEDIEGLRRALDYDKLVRTAQRLPDGRADLNSYQASMLRACIAKLDDLRRRMPNAGGLVIAPSIPVANLMAEILHDIEGERPIVVHNEIPNSDGKIEAFRNCDKRWIVSVQMIGEGIDIPRLRVLCYLPKAMTELAFRQALGRIVRNYGPQDDTRGYVVMPESAIFKNYARRVEEEMSPALRSSAESPDYKICRICSAENPLSANICHDCDTEFPAARARLKTCEHCGAFNSLSADTCQDCGTLFGHDFTLRLNSALRVGGIVRGGDYEEIEFQQGEGIADDLRTLAVRSGDEFILKMTRVAPDESLGRLSAFFDEIKRSRASK